MAQLLLIKDANTSLKTIDDIVGIFEDTHKFSDYELQAYNVIQIMGSRVEVTTKLNAVRFKTERAYKAKSTKWLRIRPEEKEVWQDADEKWHFLKEQPKHTFSLATLSAEDKAIIETTDTGLARDVVFKKMVVNPGEWDVKNTVEAKDLNG